jgi:hypothetical protein
VTFIGGNLMAVCAETALWDIEKNIARTNKIAAIRISKNSSFKILKSEKRLAEIDFAETFRATGFLFCRIVTRSSPLWFQP